MSRWPIAGVAAIFFLLVLNSVVQASWVSPEIGEESGITSAGAEQVHVRAASNGEGSLVVWSERDAEGNGDIWGARLDADGSVLDPEGILIYSGSGDQHEPDVVWDGQNYFVVWESASADNGDIYGIHVSDVGAVVEYEPIAIAVDGDRQERCPAVEFDGTYYLIAWHGDAGGIYVTAMKPTNEFPWPGSILLVDAPNEQVYPDIAYSAATQTFLVVWGDHRRTDPVPGFPDSHEWPPYDVYGMRLELHPFTGMPTFLNSIDKSLPIQIGAQCDRRPRVASDGSGFMVVDSCVNGAGIWDGDAVRMSAVAHYITDYGFVFPAVEVSDEPVDAWGTNVAFINPNYLVTWIDGMSSPPKLLAKRLSPAGSVLDDDSILVALDPRFDLETPPDEGRLLFTSNFSVNGSRAGEGLVVYTRGPSGTQKTRARLMDVENNFITASAGSGGTISPAGKVMVGAGQTVTFMILPDKGYKIASLVVDGSTLEEECDEETESCYPPQSYTFANVSQGHTITASFVSILPQAPVAHKITASAGAGGAISPAGAVMVNAGQSRTFSIIPNNGYKVLSLVVDNQPMEECDEDTESCYPPQSYTFANVSQGHTITATFVSILPQAPVTHKITASAGAGGIISPAGAVMVNAGQSRTFSIIPNNGYKVLSLVVDNQPVEECDEDTESCYPPQSYTFANVSQGHTITATFVSILPQAPVTHKITASAGAGGIISPAGAVMVNAGQSRTFSIIPNNGYKVLSLVVDNQPVEECDEDTESCYPPQSYTFANVSKGHTITASFVSILPPPALAHKITASAGAGGAISPAGAVMVNAGQSRTFSIIPNNGYKVLSLVVDNQPMEECDEDTESCYPPQSYTFANVSQGHTITATFVSILPQAPVTHKITASAGAGGIISPAGAVMVNAGQSRTFSIIPNNGYKVLSLVVDNQPVEECDEDTESCYPPQSYTFANINQAHTIAVSFVSISPQPVAHTITASAGSGGTISPAGAVTVNAGQSRTFSIIPSNGYKIASLMVDNAPVEECDEETESCYPPQSYTFANVSQGHTVAASFVSILPPTPVAHTITASAGSGGSISPVGAVTVNAGQSRTFSITPSNGYKIASLMVDNAPVEECDEETESCYPPQSYTFANVSQAHTITASFVSISPQPVAHKITASAGSGGSISPVGAVMVNAGQSRTFTITPSNGYKIASLMVDNSPVEECDEETESCYPPQSYTFANVNQAHTIAVSFVSISPQPVAHRITASAGSGGSISPVGAVMVNAGQSRTFSIIPSNGYKIASLMVDNSPVEECDEETESCYPPQSYTFANVNQAHTIAVSFVSISPQPVAHKITASAGSGGTISPAGAVTVNAGQSRTFSIIPSNGYKIASLMVDNSPVEECDEETESCYPPQSYTFANVNQAHTIAVSFVSISPQPVAHKITASAGSGGSISPVGAVMVNAGQSRTFSITPSNGYKIASLVVDNQPVEECDEDTESCYPPQSYTFANVSQGHTITATFVSILPPPALAHKITASAGAGGIISPAGAVMVNAGQTRTFLLLPTAGYRILSVVVDGSTVEEECDEETESCYPPESYTFYAVNQTHTITASFVHR